MFHFCCHHSGLAISDFSISESIALLSNKEKNTFQLLLTRYFISLPVSMSHSREEFDSLQGETTVHY